MLSPELRQKAEELVGRYPVGRSALLPLLHLVQAQDGYVSDDGVAECAQLLGLTKAEIAAVATFYSMYKRAPMGRHLVSVCTNFSCAVRGGQEVYDRLTERLGVGHNETTSDGGVTLEHAECLGNCEGAPVVTVDYLNYECVAPEQALELVERVMAGDELPPPTRGFSPPGVRDIEYRLAGLGPRHGDGVGHPTDQARADDAGVPVPEAGPGAEPLPVTPEFSEVRERERRAAKEAVAAAGHDSYEVEDAAGPRAREFATHDADWEPRRPHAGEATPAEFVNEPGEGRLGAEQAPEGMGADSGTGGGHEYPPASGGEGSGESSEGEDE